VTENNPPSPGERNGGKKRLGRTGRQTSGAQRCGPRPGQGGHVPLGDQIKEGGTKKATEPGPKGWGKEGTKRLGSSVGENQHGRGSTRGPGVGGSREKIATPLEPGGGKDKNPVP